MCPGSLRIGTPVNGLDVYLDGFEIDEIAESDRQGDMLSAGEMLSLRMVFIDLTLWLTLVRQTAPGSLDI